MNSIMIIIHQIKYLMTIFLSVLFSFVLLSNKGLESHDSPDLDDADSSNFRWRSNRFLCFCSLQAVRNSAKANPANPSTMRPMPMNACHGRRYFCTIQSTITDTGIANIVPTLCNKCKDADFFTDNNGQYTCTWSTLHAWSACTWEDTWRPCTNQNLMTCCK